MADESTKHPQKALLVAFGLGKLDEADAEKIAAHLDACQECSETIINLQDDTFVSLVRKSTPPADCNLVERELSVVQDTSPQKTADLEIGSTENVGEAADLPSELLDHSRYEVQELLGRGGMGNVYRAEHKLMNRSVALKVINQELVKNAQAVKRFRREVQSAAQLAHSNIVTAYDAEQVGDMHLLVMEYVQGDNLADVVKREGPLRVDQACNYIRQAALGLQHAHEKGMVHRDIKPHNLMVTAKGLIKILDFGLATLANEPTTGDAGDLAETQDSASNLTSAGSMMGTPDFISPEQASDARTADIRSDIYSLGCTFYYLLTGRPPFSEGSAMERVRAHSEQECEPIETIRPDVPAEVVAIVRRMVAKDPAQRYQTPAEVAKALTRFLATRNTTPVAEKNRERAAGAAASARSWRSRRKIVATALAAFAFLFAAIIYVSTDGGTFEVVSDDDNVEITIRPITADGKDASGKPWQFRVTDTATGSEVKWLRSGEYVLDFKGDNNDFALDKDRFVLKRGGRIVVKVSRKQPGGVASETTMPSAADVEDASERVIVETRMWASSRHIGPGTISRDGKTLPYVDWRSGDVGLRNLKTKKNRILVESRGSKGYSDATPVISPDGKRVVFNWYQNGWASYGLRLCGIDGSQVTALYRNDEVRWIRPCDWSKDGKHILALFVRQDHTQQMALVSVEDRSARIIKSFDWNGPSNMRFSPDGDSIVYDRAVQLVANRPPNADIFVLDYEQNREVPLVQHPANDNLLGWAPDSKTILFSSDRRGTVDAWTVDTAGSSEAILVKKGIGHIDPIGFTMDASFYYSTYSSLRDVYVATIDVETGELAERRKKLSRFREGGNMSPDWSSDGRQLAYIHPRNRARITIVTLETEEYRELYPDLAYIRGKGARWSPNGTSFVLAATDKKGRNGIYQVHAMTGETTLMRSGNETRVSQPEWTPDGKSIVFSESRRARSPEASVRMWIRNIESGDEKEIPGDWDSLVEPSFALSPNGAELAYVTHDEKSANLKVVFIDGGEARLLHQEKTRGIGRVEWARSGDRVIFEKTSTDWNTELWQVSVKDGSARPLGLLAKGVAGNGFIYPRMHPDGRQIAFAASSEEEQSARSEVWALENFLPSLDKPNQVDSKASKPEPDLHTGRRQQDSLGPRIRFVESHFDQKVGISPDGAYISFVDWSTGNLAIRDLATGKMSQLTSKGSAPASSAFDFAYWSKPSRDGRQIAYAAAIGHHEARQLHVVDVETGESRLLFDNPDGAYVIPTSWSKDGQGIVAAFRPTVPGAWQIELFSAKDGSHLNLKSLDWRRPRGVDMSPDGDYIVYSAQLDQDSPDSDIFLLSTDGTREVTLVEHPAIDSQPLWTPDGRGIVFLSDRSGSKSLWYLKVTDGKPQGEAILAVDSVDSDFSIGLTADSSYYFVKTRRNFRLSGDLYVAKLDATGSAIEGPPQKMILRSESGNTLPSWSTDGSLFAYTRRTQNVGLVVRNMGSGQEHELFPSVTWWIYPRDCVPRWSPDGEVILVSGRVKGRNGLYSIDLQSGNVLPVVQDEWVHRFVCSPDGKVVYYLRQLRGKEVEEIELVSKDLLTQTVKVLDRYSPNEGLDYGLAISPDGQQLAVASLRSIWLTKIANGTRHEIYTLPENEVIPEHVGIAWTPIGNSVIFAKRTLEGKEEYNRFGRARKSEFWKVSVEDGTAVDLNLAVDGLRQLSLHPDGQQITYTQYPPGAEPRAEIWAIDNFLPALESSLR